MNLVRIGLVGLFCAQVGGGVAFGANGSSADSGSVSKIAPVARSGNTGSVNVSSQAINTGSTGDAQSTAIASPESHAGSGGGQGGPRTRNTRHAGPRGAHHQCKPTGSAGGGGRP